jgi:Tol biopolymer transport system component
MKWLYISKMRLVLIGFIAALVFGSGNAKADYIFGEPTNLGSVVNSSAYDEAPSISADGLTLYFNSNRSGGYGAFDLWMTTRPTKEDPWGSPENLGPMVNSSSREGGASISADGLSLYFNSTRPGGYGPVLWGDIWMTERDTTSDLWGNPVNLGPIINSSSHALGASISYDGLSLFFGSDRASEPGNDDICVTTRATTDDPWQEPVNLGSVVNSSAHDGGPSISSDCLALFFSGYAIAPHRSGGYGNADLWITTRPSVYDPWREPLNLGSAVNTSDYDFLPCISADGRTLYFMSDRPGGSGLWDLWQVSIEPVVDLNGDGIVDAADMCMIVDHWDEDYSLCDIGPMPWGDGVVDVQDLIVLAEHLFEEIFPPELVAYWKLDETEGNLAHNSISDNHGILSGNPTWQPDIGHAAGALGCDGIDDYISIDFVLNPMDGSFSVFAWTKGGTPGQVILSQTDGPGGAGEIWLGADAVEGKLMNTLRSPSGRSPAPPMVADAVITDERWHHVGIVVTEHNVRNLYVDGIRAAFDTQPIVLPSSDGGLHIGSGKNLEAGTFLSGLIDDVRIYNVALTAEKITALTQ